MAVKTEIPINLDTNVLNSALHFKSFYVKMSSNPKSFLTSPK